MSHERYSHRRGGIDEVAVLSMASPLHNAGRLRIGEILLSKKENYYKQHLAYPLPELLPSENPLHPL